MKNITLSVDEEVLAAARRYAVERDTTVNGLVRDFLTRIASQETRAKEAIDHLLRLSDESEAEIGPISWTRDDLYER